jgi:hypothetical protein
MSDVEADAVYARRLEQEMREQEAAEVAAASRVTTRTTSLASSDNDLTGDREYARRVEQELEDEEVARRISMRDEQRVSQRTATAIAQSRARQPWTVRRVCSYFIPLAVIGGIAVGLIYLFSDEGGLPDFFPDFEDFAQEDPFNQTGPEGADRWRNNGSGLRLEVVNALDDDWFEFFYKAIQDWDAGTPDVLSLTTSVRSPDPSCVSLDGKLKVCNSDYGPTNWRGR